MKQKYLMKKWLIGCLIFTLILSIIGCNHTNSAYSCEIMEPNLHEQEQTITSAPPQDFKIGQSTFTVQLSSKAESVDTHERYDVYAVVDASDTPVNKTIRVHTETGKMVGFYGIRPYDKIENIENLSDEELKTIVEQTMGDAVDFSAYNTFRVMRPVSPSGQYCLCWQVKEEIFRDIRVDIHITSDGHIQSFSQTNNCPDDLTVPFLPIEERTRLIEDTLCEHLEIKSIKGIRYKILYETLSYYQGKDAILYQIEVVKDGFSQIVSLVIS